MKRKSPVDRKSRRGFLKDLAAAGGTVAVASVVNPALADTDTEAEDQAKPESPRGYRVTRHIAKYYRLARL